MIVFILCEMCLMHVSLCNDCTPNKARVALSFLLVILLWLFDVYMSIAPYMQYLQNYMLIIFHITQIKTF